MANENIRAAAKESGVHLWELAAAVGLNDGNLSRKLRFELPAEEQQRLIGIIHRIKEERHERASTC